MNLISIFLLVAVAEQASFNLTWSEILKRGISCQVPYNRPSTHFIYQIKLVKKKEEDSRLIRGKMLATGGAIAGMFELFFMFSQPKLKLKPTVSEDVVLDTHNTFL